MSKSLLVLFTLTLLIFTGCSRQGELQGTVFVVTNGADNVKLSLVKVTAIPENEISKFIENKKSFIKNVSNKFSADKDLIKPEIEKNQKNFDEAKRVYDDLTAQRDNLQSKKRNLNSSFIPYLAEESLYPEYETPKTNRNASKTNICFRAKSFTGK